MRLLQFKIIQNHLFLKTEISLVRSEKNGPLQNYTAK